MKYDGIDWPIAGRSLRWLLVACLLRADGELTVEQLMYQLEAQGTPPEGRASKAISDAIRWEVRKGRVRRVRWGTYAKGTMPDSTRRWILRRADEVRARHCRSDIA